MAPSESDQPLPIIVGIDFGTTFSGIAWAINQGDKAIEVVSSWPGGKNQTKPKAPTTISYSGTHVAWGFQTTTSKEVIHGIKLLLDENQRSRYDPSLATKKLLSRLDKTPEDVVADYIGKILDHVKDILIRRFGSSVNQANMEFILTVPAVWSDKAKESTLQAAARAGIPRNKLLLLSEPESAALYSLRAIQPNTIQKRDILVVCDAGGGTVDLISYCVENVSPLSLKEVVEGTGGLCGSMILDEHFERFLETLLGTQQFEKIFQRARDNAREFWKDKIKPSFTGNDCDDFEELEWFLPLPGPQEDPSIDLVDGFLQITKSQVQAIFDPVVQDVIDLVYNQVRSIKAAALSVKAILLVGGFGGSEYLYHRLDKAYPKIDVLQPPDAWQAVVHGAVLRGLSGNEVKSRLARGHYGIECEWPFDPLLHNESDKFWCHCEQEWRAENQMEWFIQKETSISEYNPIRRSYCRYRFVDSNDPIIFKETIYFFASDVAPQRKSQGVVKLCDLRSDLSQIPKRLFEKRTNSAGLEYYSINYDLVMIPKSAYIHFQLEFNGTSYGSIQAQY